MGGGSTGRVRKMIGMGKIGEVRGGAWKRTKEDGGGKVGDLAGEGDGDDGDGDGGGDDGGTAVRRRRRRRREAAVVAA